MFLLGKENEKVEICILNNDKTELGWNGKPENGAAAKSKRNNKGEDFITLELSPIIGGDWNLYFDPDKILNSVGFDFWLVSLYYQMALTFEQCIIKCNNCKCREVLAWSSKVKIIKAQILETCCTKQY